MDVDFVMQNVEQTETYPIEKEIQLEAQRDIHKLRSSRYKEKREEDLLNKERFNFLSLSKWDFIRVKRSEYEEDVAERTRNRNQVKELAVRAFTD